MEANIGVIGLGVMGENLILQLCEKGYKVGIYNRTSEKTKLFTEKFKDINVIPTFSLKEFSEKLNKPRIIILLIKAGSPVDETINLLINHLDEHDIIIDAGNSYFKDSDRRFDFLNSKNINFLGLGVSGGVEGARKGLSIMAGGNKEAYYNIIEILKSISAKYENEYCLEYFGKGGAGHFVKIIHNGIEYALMENIAETYFLLKSLGYNNEEISSIFQEWNKGILKSYLLNATSIILKKKEDENYLIDLILDKSEQKGTGIWCVGISLEKGIPTPSIASAVYSRILSYNKFLRLKYSKIYGKKIEIKGKINLEDLKNSLLLSNLIVYLQGISLLETGESYGYSFKFYDALKVWRNGSIIRSSLVEILYLKSLQNKDLLEDLEIKEIILNNLDSLSKVLSFQVNNNLPSLVFSSNFNYLVYYFKENLPANIIQALRDFFGAHGFERKDKEGYFHVDWTS